MKSVYVLITGRVQGVGYRHSTAKKAHQLQVMGWVRNREDGAVEGLFQGEESALHELLTWCEHGPSGALVDSVQVYPKEDAPCFNQFEIVR